MDRLGNVFECNPQIKLIKEKEYPLIDIDSITIGRKYPTPKELIKYIGQSGSRFCSGDTIMARITPCLENGKIAMVKTDKEACIGSTELFVFRGKKDKSINEYVYYFMKQDWIRNYAANSMTGASGRQRANLDFIKRIQFDFPNCEIQEKIVNYLIKYDELIENNNSRILILEQMAEEVYKEWFARFKFPNNTNYSFIESKPYGWIYGNESTMKIPSKWHFGRLDEIGSFIRGKNITSSEMQDGEIPVISAGIEPSGYHNESNVKGMSLTMSASGANAGYLKYNLGDIWAADCSYYQNDDNIWFVYSSLKFIESAIKNLQVGSAQPHVYAKNINKLNIIIPEEKYIKMYNDFVNPMFEEIKKINEKNKILTKQRDLLLPRLMSGKLDVK